MNSINFKEFIKSNIVIFDGAMGTILQENGLKAGDCPENLNITNPDLIERIHNQYIKSGSRVITSNTFGANRKKSEYYNMDYKEIIEKGLEIAKKAANKSTEKIFVAQDISSIGEMLEPMGTLTFEECYELYKEQVLIGKKFGVDLFLVETMSDLSEVRAAILAIKENSDIPCAITMTFEENFRTFSGCLASSFAITATALGADIIGVNCSLGPIEIYNIVKEVIKYTNLPILVQPNAGLPNSQSENLKFDIDADEFSNEMIKYLKIGVSMFGGCCGTTPEYIKKLNEKININKDMLFKREKIDLTVVCSQTKIVEIDNVKIIGERINPTGKKLFKQALIENDIDYILKQAFEQINSGADILDVNVGLPEIDEPLMLKNVIKKIQSIIDTPLQLDSSNPEALEMGLRAYTGKCIVNSVNGDDDILDKILPLIKKYGASVIGLTLNNAGIPQTCEDRINIAKHIIEKCEKYGIEKKDIFIDCLVLTASAQQKQVIETLKAVKIVREQLGCKTVLGISNISFGLPDRECINQTFLSMALMNGLNLPIINPNIKSMRETVLAFNILTNNDENSKEYIKYKSDNLKSSDFKTEQGFDDSKIDENSIEFFIRKGFKEKTADKTKLLLNDYSTDEIINNFLIPTLDNIGDEFEKGILFLPQLIQAAESAKCAFEVIKNKISNTQHFDNVQPDNEKQIILATVKGDIHDIGKNIVKIVLENYGYKIIDLGKNVSPEEIVKTAINKNVRLIGLSALMTTTIVNMEETIKHLKSCGHECSVMVGGAVLTKEYAEKIGADYYAKDAKASVEIAKKFFNNR